MNLASPSSRRTGAIFSLRLSVLLAMFSLLLACCALSAASISAGAAERADLHLSSSSNTLLSLLGESGAPAITLQSLPASPSGDWSNSLQPATDLVCFLTGGKSIPVVIFGTPGTVAGGNNMSITVQVNQVGGSVLVSCDHPGLLTPPGGSWPYTLNFPSGGSTSQSFTVSTSAVSSNTTVKIYACESDLDINNPANWQATNTCLVMQPAGP